MRLIVGILLLKLSTAFVGVEAKMENMEPAPQHSMAAHSNRDQASIDKDSDSQPPPNAEQASTTVASSTTQTSKATQSSTTTQSSSLTQTSSTTLTSSTTQTSKATQSSSTTQSSSGTQTSSTTQSSTATQSSTGPQAPVDTTSSAAPGSGTQSTSDTQPASETASQVDKNSLINHLIEHILATSKTGHYVGNAEFDQQSALLRVAGNLGPELVTLKHHAFERFISYNALRLKLEADMANRIAVIDNYFHTEPLSDACKLYYHTQKKELLGAARETNSLKAYKLTIYADNCPYEESDEIDDSDEDYSFFWPIWNSILG